MPGHNLQQQLENVKFDSAGSFFTTPEGKTWGHGKTVGNGVEGWAPGAVFVHTDGAINRTQYRNYGTKTTAAWMYSSGYASGEVAVWNDGARCWMADNALLTLGTGYDVNLMWNGTYLEGGGPALSAWVNAPSEAAPGWQEHSFRLFDDFFEFDGTATVGNWLEAVVGTGTTALNTGVPGGELLMTCQATTDDAAEQISYVSAPFKLAAGKTLWYETRLKQVGDVQSEVSFGLASLNENLTAAADVYPEDGVCFAHQDASMALALTCSKSGTNTGAVAAVHTMVTNVYATYGLLIDGVTSVTPFINGVKGTAATATICDDQSLAPYFLVRNGDATTQQKLHIDYCKVVQLR